MSSINYEKKVFLVSKRMINQMIYPIKLNNNTYINLNINNNCRNCPFFNSIDKTAIKYCTEFCDKKTSSLHCSPNIRKHINIVRATHNAKFNKESLANFRLNRLLAKKEQYLTPIQMKLMLAFYHISNTNGIINCLSMSELAKFINCSTKSVHNGSKVLESLGFITYRVSDKNNITVVIHDFKKDFLKDGKGYIVMSTGLFKKLITVKKLHEMRLCLKLLLNHDANVHFGNKTLFSIDRLKSFLPRYKTSLTNLKKFLKNILNLFKDGIQIHNYMNIDLSFSIDDSINGNVQRNAMREEFKDKFTDEISNVIESLQQDNIIYKMKSPDAIIPHMDEKISSLVELSIEYDYVNVNKALSIAPSDILMTPLNKFGAFMRYLLQHHNSSILSLEDFALR